MAGPVKTIPSRVSTHRHAKRRGTATDQLTPNVLPLPETPEQLAAMMRVIKSDWGIWARPDQLPPKTDWDIWCILSGRGWGKTRVGAQTVNMWAESGKYPIIHLIARTAADIRDTMVEGESGILACAKPWFAPRYNPSKRRIVWPNGTVALTFTAEQPEQLRGPQCHAWWADELASWRYIEDSTAGNKGAWSNLQMGARLGEHVLGIVTSTPRPVPIIKKLVAAAKTGNPWKVHLTRGATMDNRDNLSPSFVQNIMAEYDGTRLGRQELYGEILDDNPNALWQRAWIDRDRVANAPALRRIVVSVDPAGTSKETSDKVGITVQGRDSKGDLFLLEDSTMKGTPKEWGTAVVACYHRWKADKVVAESNFGGEMVSHVINSIDEDVPVKLVTASRGKAVRAEPISAKAEQGKIHHVGMFSELEDELCEWDPLDKNAKSPNRLDAMVWGMTDLGSGSYFAGGGNRDVGP